jgi:hypothetical protein
MRVCRKLWPVLLLVVIAACEQPDSGVEPSGNPNEQGGSASASHPITMPEAGLPPATSPSTPPAPATKDQATSYVQSCIDRILGGDETLRTKGPFSLLTLGFAGGTIDTIKIVTFVQAYSSEGEMLKDQFKVKLEAEGTDYLGRSRKETVPYKVELKDGKWSIDFLIEEK